MRLTTQQFLAAVYGIFMFFASLCIAWSLMYKTDFLYGVWHDHGGIKEGIEHFGPKNRFKPGFGDTTRAQRLELFQQINIAVHHSGEGLESIRYISPSSRGDQRLLRGPEVIHLKDVAHLIDILKWPFYLILLCALVMVGRLILLKRQPPVLIHQVAGVASLLLVSIAILVVFGAENVFNTLHIWVFPADNQWFFYYQESLMSTMMLAPTLFGWIALALVVLTLVIFCLLSLIVKQATLRGYPLIQYARRQHTPEG